MISTRTIISSIKEIPETWIFEKYVGISEKLDGRDIKMKSLFNPLEKTPSMFIYYAKDGTYKFKDFSSGHHGNAMKLVQLIFNIDYPQAVAKVMHDYNEFMMNGNYSINEFKKHSKYQVCDYEARQWTTLDEKYWMQYKIGSKTLEKYNVMALSSYSMRKDDNQIVITGNHIYGYFRSDGLLYKIYQPKVESKKFLKIRSYTQGLEQLTYLKPNLVIHSSLKDMMAFEQLHFKTIECIAPDSENTILPDALMWDLIEKYENVICIFDNDEAGKKAIQKYSEKYGVRGFVFDMEKDISDSIAKYGTQIVKNALGDKLVEELNR
jgi:hypothetical protein